MRDEPGIQPSLTLAGLPYTTCVPVSGSSSCFLERFPCSRRPALVRLRYRPLPWRIPSHRSRVTSPSSTWSGTMMDRGTRAVIVDAGMVMGPDGVADGATEGAAAVALFATNALTALVGGLGASTGAWIIGAARAEVLETPERETARRTTRRVFTMEPCVGRHRPSPAIAAEQMTAAFVTAGENRN